MQTKISKEVLVEASQQAFEVFTCIIKALSENISKQVSYLFFAL
jgi:hypothetical protein